MNDEQSASAGAATDEYRLSQAITPEYYEIRLTPDLKAFTFAGEEHVRVKVNAPAREVVLNALELEIDRAAAARVGKTLAAEIEFLPAQERVRLTFAEPLTAGEWTLRLAFRGVLNDKLHGFYRSQYVDSAGVPHTIATTQFEATDARRAFPCWDEPEFKAVFKVTMVVEAALTALSNAGVERETPLAGGKKEVVFKETIRMSTYLVAFIVGEFEATDPLDAGTPLRIVHVPGKGALSGWAGKIGVFSLTFFADYYGLKYPGDKLDLIAIPDFASGAMENLGAITFRETALLADEKSAARAELERVADVVSHENAHMWFGDLVTMKWWNGIWLNEAFATFMEMLAVDAWKPQWKRWESFSVSRAAAMAVDGLSSTRPIEFAVHGPEDARAMFDILTYEKGAAVLRMLEQYLKPGEFRKGIALYLRRHQYANAETGDLWDALEESSRQPVRKMMDSWIFQPGFPIVEAAVADGGRALRLRQRRFFYLSDHRESEQVWQVPLIIRAKTDRGVETHRLLLGERESVLKLPGALEWALINEGGHGFYRVRYDAELAGALARNLADLKPIERFALVSDTWAATVAGMVALEEFLTMTELFREETDLNVWRALIGAFAYLDMIANDAQRPRLSRHVRALLSPALERLTWAPKKAEDELQGQLRGAIVSALGTLGDDPEVQKRASELYARYENQPSVADRDLGPALVNVLAHAGGRARYTEFKGKFKAARTPQEEQRYMFALAGFRAIELLRETMAMTLGPEVRTQNAPYLIHALLLNTTCSYEAWDFARRNWEEITQKFPDNSLPRMCEAVVGLLDRESEVKEFFKAHRVRLGGKIIDQHLERLSVAVAFRAREGENLTRLLAG